MKRYKLVLCLFAYAALASACSGFGNKEAKKEEPKMEEKLTINQHAELIMSKTLPAFGAIVF